MTNSNRESNCYCVKMLNAELCELDAELHATLADAKTALLRMIERCVLCEGDIFVVRPAWSEQYADNDTTEAA